MPKGARIPSCHPNRAHEARGLCKSCYNTLRCRDNPLWKQHHDYNNKKSYRRSPDILRFRHLKTRYNITPSDWKAIVSLQKGSCPVCLQMLHGKLDVDHDPVSRKIRGILHHRCNTALGSYEYLKNITSIEQVEKYLETHEEMVSCVAPGVRFVRTG